jgi:hypothetical protein
MVARLSREPLVHFLLLGLLLFLLYAVLGGGGGDRRIRVDDKVVAGLTAQFELTWQRPPTAAELDALIETYVREEIFYREGLALGLDQDDPLIKRRVRQKFEVMAEESEAAEPPTDAQLNDWLKAHADRYANPAIVTFEQILVDPAAHGGSSRAAVLAARKALASGVDPAEIGTGRMLPPRFDLFPIDLVERDLGSGFAKALPTLRSGEWEGPVRSGYGLHLVKLDKLLPGRMPHLDEVRRAVTRDWEADRRKRAADGYYRRLRDGYRIDLVANMPKANASQ